ncbi:hypothetical protein EON81_25755 [bacterium]|nr:MAG: hypothetical protein EON81_25755 [bacterium]
MNRWFLRFIPPGKKMHELSRGDFVALRERLVAAGLSPNTRRGVLSRVRVYVRAANDILGTRIEFPEFAQVSSDRTPSRKAQRWLRPDEISKLLPATEGQFTTACLLGLKLGLRPEEILGLRWQSVDLNAGWLIVNGTVVRSVGGEEFVERTKNEAGYRHIPIPSRLRQHLRDVRAVYPRAKFVISKEKTNGIGHYRSPWQVDHMKAARIKAGLDDGSSHYDQLGLDPPSMKTLRKTFGTMLSRTGIDGLHKSYVFGHSAEKLTVMDKHYAQVLPQRLVSFVQMVEDYVDGLVEFQEAESFPEIRGS